MKLLTLFLSRIFLINDLDKSYIQANNFFHIELNIMDTKRLTVLDLVKLPAHFTDLPRACILLECL